MRKSVLVSGVISSVVTLAVVSLVHNNSGSTSIIPLFETQFVDAKTDSQGHDIVKKEGYAEEELQEYDTVPKQTEVDAELHGHDIVPKLTLDVSKNDAPIHTATRVCTQAERLAHMATFCKAGGIFSKPGLMTPAGENMVDFKHNLTLCLMSKAGCTAIKAFLLAANGFRAKPKSLGDSMEFVHKPWTQNKYGLWQMRRVNESRWKEISETFYNILSIRHPFDRLVSYYRDKIADATDKKSSHRSRQVQILKYMHRNISGNPTFTEFLTWASATRLKDAHWNLISETCHPCAHMWGLMMRVETMAVDSQLLIKKIPSQVTQLAAVHSHNANTTTLSYSKHLPIYENISAEVMDYWMKFYREDMEMFGYHWDKEAFTASCSILTQDGYCC